MYNQPFNYNPYMQPQYNRMQQPMPQVNENLTTNLQPNLTTQRPSLNGRQVDSLEMAKAIEYPLDGSINYYPLIDNSKIITKQLQNDGTTKITIYKPINETKEEIKYITRDDMEKAINGLDLGEIDDIKEEIKELKQEIKDLKKKKKGDE